jgi:hypothetical protein
VDTSTHDIDEKDTLLRDIPEETMSDDEVETRSQFIEAKDSDGNEITSRL